MPICAICNVGRSDLTRHLKADHNITVDEYKKQYNAIVVDHSVEEKRKLTCLDKYGISNYKNGDAKKLSNEIFEGGHSLSDPKVREKACKTKQELYGDPNFTNREKAKRTVMVKYGVESVAHIPGVIDKRKETLINKYGRVFNYIRPPTITKEVLIDLHINQRKTLKEIGLLYNIKWQVVSYWMKKYSIKALRISKKLK
jgi:hypothetical protein